MNTVHFGEATAAQIPSYEPNSSIIPPSNPPPPSPKHFNWQWHKWVLVSIAVLTFSLAVAYLANRPQFLTQTQSPQTPLQVVQTTPTPDPTANWKTYTNTQHGYSIKYPQAMLIKNYNSNTISFTENFDFFDQVLIEYPAINPEECRALCPTIDRATVVSINGVLMKKLEGLQSYQKYNTAGKYISYVAQKNSIYYLISYRTNVTGEDNISIRVFDQILSTFRFE